MLAVGLPDTSEVRLSADLRSHFVRENDVFLPHDLGSEFAKDVIFLLESSTTLRGSGIQTEDSLLVLIGVGERVENSISFLVVVGVFEHMATMSPPEGLRLFVVEKSGSKSVSELFPTEPLERVRFITVSHELGRSPFRVEIVHGVIPGLAGVDIVLPSVLLFSLGPVGNSESLEHGAGLSVESDITYALEESGGVEVLSVQMVHDVRLLVEFVMVNVLDTETSFSGFLDMEAVGDEEQVRMCELDSV